jgi:branched-chain amino acid transport system ATP-binding protein
VTRALMSRPQVLLLDEMSTGLAPRVVERLLDTVREAAADGVAVLMAEPTMARIESFVHRGYVMIRGRVVEEAETATELHAAYRAQMGVHA